MRKGETQARHESSTKGKEGFQNHVQVTEAIEGRELLHPNQIQHGMMDTFLCLPGTPCEG